MKLRCKRGLEYVKVVPCSRCSTGLRVLLRDDQVAIQPTMIPLLYFISFSLWPQATLQIIPFLPYQK